MAINRTLVVAALVVLSGCSVQAPAATAPTATGSAPTTTVQAPDVTITISASRWPNVADHWADAQAAGESPICTLDRDGADQRREESLRGHPTAAGMDRDEYPMAMCEEGGAGADVRLVPSGENRSQGAWVGNRLEPYPDGTRVRFVIR